MDKLLESISDSENRQVIKHQSELCRLNRALGQIEGIKKMIITERYCVDIMIQLKAVQAALKNVELNILTSHMQDCIEKAVRSSDKTQLTQKISELSELIKKFD
jgi:DNA-binding FrmR family transcriptional regulator